MPPSMKKLLAGSTDLLQPQDDVTVGTPLASSTQGWVIDFSSLPLVLITPLYKCNVIKVKAISLERAEKLLMEDEQCGGM